MAGFLINQPSALIEQCCLKMILDTFRQPEIKKHSEINQNIHCIHFEDFAYI
ncbi:hypothetical protein [Alysiella sp.]|uniref:hypothetical protein n=1 Tax=Alysiella sp. TaxID=1872483 RepID=UPI0026DBFBF9|nr:hypothetical protein [Alysiella sp.]